MIHSPALHLGRICIYLMDAGRILNPSIASGSRHTTSFCPFFACCDTKLFERWGGVAGVSVT
jgi:hypothetical protein